MKKIIVLILLLITSIIFVSCSNEYEDKKVGILIYDENDTFMSEYVSELELKLKGKVSYDISYAEKSQYIQNKQFNNYLDKGYDLIIINAVDRLSSPTLIQRAELDNVPLIFINREPLDILKESVNSYYVGANSLQIGRLQADLVGQMVENNELIDHNADNIIQLVILKGEQGHQDAEKRTSEVLEALKRRNIDYEVLSINIAGWSRELAYSQMKMLSEKITDIDLVISNNDDMALGAIDYLMETDYYTENNELPSRVIGTDGTRQGISAINNDLLYGTIINDYKNQAKYIDKLVDYLILNNKDENFNYNNRFLLVESEIYVK